MNRQSELQAVSEAIGSMVERKLAVRSDRVIVHRAERRESRRQLAVQARTVQS